MAKGGKKHRLLLYEHMLERWWPNTLVLAIVLFAWGGACYFNLWDLNTMWMFSRNDGIVLMAVGGLVLLFTFFVFVTRKAAYIQLFGDHFKIATPFFRLNVSYKRIQRTTTTQISDLFPPKNMSGYKRDIIAPISGKTAIILHLTSYPLSRRILRMFLSPFFFHDKTPHFIIMVDDWMGFSQELESRRVGGARVPTHRKTPAARMTSNLLDDLRKK